MARRPPPPHAGRTPAAALEALPPIGGNKEKASLQATGTDGARARVTEKAAFDVQRAGQRADGPAGPSESAPVLPGDDMVAPAPDGLKSSKRKNDRRLVASGHHLSQLDADELAGAPPRTRTLDPLIKSQLLYQLS